MGQFSWIYSDTKEQMINGRMVDSYLLVPPPFQEKYGISIHTHCYDGYGNFGAYDVFDLVAEWNKEMIPEIIRRVKNGSWKCSVRESEIKNLINYYEGKPISCELRILGITMACYDEDNFALEYPIKIVTKDMDYFNVLPSRSDPNQGWL